MRKYIVLYIHNQKQVILVNWKKYGCWCGVGGYIEGNIEKMNVLKRGQEIAQELCGIDIEIVKLAGVLKINEKDERFSETVYCYHAYTSNTLIQRYKGLNNAKWVEFSKILNYKLFPNSDRHILKAVQRSNYFEITLDFDRSTSVYPYPVRIRHKYKP